MKYGIVLTTGDPAAVADLAAAAEVAGWDGVFTWDAIAFGDGDVWDPWILLAAMAARTRRVRLGAMVFAPTRRRPWKLAREITTLDHLCNGRLVLPVGLGAIEDAGLGAVGEPVEARVRAQLLDETLAIVDGLSSGEPFGFNGEHYRFAPMTFRPRPVQRPRVPVWVVGAWPHDRSMRRTLRWDGIVVQGKDADGVPSGAPVDLEDIATWVRAKRVEEGVSGPFEIVAGGSTPADEPAEASAIVGRCEAAGATWWVEADWASMSADALRKRVAAGPPRS